MNYTPTPEPVALDRSDWRYSALDTEAHITASLGQPLPIPDHITAALGDNYATECEALFCRWFARTAHATYVEVFRDNTYNHEQDLTAQVVFSVFAPVSAADWCYCSDVFVVVELHLGGDVRGNYGPAQVYRVDNIAETGFFDWCLGWHVAPVNPAHDPGALERINDRIGIGYSSHPSSELERLIMPNSTPAWSEKRGSWVAMLTDYPAPVLLTPCAPYYC